MTTLLGLDLSKNVSFFTIPAALTLALAPNLYAIAQAGKTYDLNYPRTLIESVSKSKTISKTRRQRIIRAKAAADNSFETLGFFAGAVIAANQARLPALFINACAIGYLIDRVAFNVFYVQFGGNRKFAPVRTVIWMVGVGLSCALYVKAGLKMATGRNSLF